MYNFFKTYFKTIKHERLIEKRINRIKQLQKYIYGKHNSCYEHYIFDSYCWFVSNDSEITSYMRYYHFNKLLKGKLSMLCHGRYKFPTEEERIKFISNGTKTLNLILNNKQQPEKNVMIHDLESCINLFSDIAYYVIEQKLKERLEKLQYKLNKLSVN